MPRAQPRQRSRGRLGDPDLGVDERALSRLWEAQALVDLPLRTTDERAVRVVSPGHRCPGPGPDFRDVVLQSDDGAVWRGDLELHARSGDWRAHGHDRDPNYDRVVAHLVLAASGAPARRRDGHAIPTIPVAAHLPPAGAALDAPARPCRAADPPAVGALLAELSLERLERKALALAAAGAPDDAAPLHAALIAALGYPHNRAPYRTVAERVPLAALRPLLALPLPARIWELEARLLGAAGLLPSPSRLRSPDAQRARAMRARAAPWRPLAWRTVGLRPANAPARRLVAAAHLLARALPAGLPAYILAPLALQEPADRWRALLARLLVYDRTGFWAGRVALGRTLAYPLPALVGPDRARSLVLDVVLPWAYLTDRERAVATWRAAPRLASTWPERHVLRAAGLLRLSGGAAQQGALHVFRHWCHHYDCTACPVGAGGGAAASVAYCSSAIAGCG